METLTFGISHLPPYLYVDESNLEGLIAPYYRSLNYYIFDTFNITFKSVEAGGACDLNGICNKQLHSLQSGIVDTVIFVRMFDLPSIPTNISIASIANGLGCYIFYKPEITVSWSHRSYFDLIYYLHPVFWVLVVILLLLILNISIKLTLTGFISYWKLFAVLISQYTHEKMIKQLPPRTIYITLFVILLLGTIFTASLQTGLVENVDYIRFNTFDDVMDHQYSIIFVGVSCKSMFDKSAGESFNHLANRVVYFNFTNQPPIQVFYQITKPKRVTVDENFQFQAMKALSCMFDSSLIYKSDRSVFNILNIVIYNKFVSSKIADKIKKYTYTSFEMSLTKNHKVLRIGLSATLMNAKPSQVCLNHQYDYQPESIITPISVEYLQIPMIILLIGKLISIIILMLEILFKNHLK